jgi:hypothetical protein
MLNTFVIKSFQCILMFACAKSRSPSRSNTYLFNAYTRRQSFTCTCMLTFLFLHFKNPMDITQIKEVNWNIVRKREQSFLG